MHEPHGIRVPRGILLGALALIVFTGGAIAFGRATETGLLETPAMREAEGRELLFRARIDGGMDVLGEAGVPIAAWIVEGDSFAMTAVRGLALQHGVDPIAEGYRLRLGRGRSGALALTDPATGRSLPLTGFGPVNIAAFAVYLGAAQSASDQTQR